MQIVQLLQQDPDKIYLFRYDKENGGFEGIFMPRLVLRNFEVVKQTSLSYIINDCGVKRTVSKTSRKRFAYPTVREALDNCQHRTRMAISLQSARLERQKGYQKVIEKEVERMELMTQDISDEK